MFLAAQSLEEINLLFTFNRVTLQAPQSPTLTVTKFHLAGPQSCALPVTKFLLPQGPSLLPSTLCLCPPAHLPPPLASPEPGAMKPLEPALHSGKKKKA